MHTTFPEPSAVSAAMRRRSRDGYLTGRAKLGYLGRRTEFEATQERLAARRCHPRMTE